MHKTRMFSLNIISIIALSIMIFFSWQYLTIGASHLRADYSIFYHTLNARGPVYQKYYARYINQTPQSAPQLAVNLNTPTMNLILKGLLNISAHLSVNVLIWTLLSVLLSLFSVYLLLLYYGGDHCRLILPFTFLFWMSWPGIYTQIGGEVSYIVLPVLCAAFFLGYLKKWRTMAVMLGLLVSLKIFFLIFILGFLMRREWKLGAVFVASFLFFFFVPMIYFSWQNYVEFFQLPNDQQVFISHSGFSMNGALLGFVLNSLYFFHVSTNFTQLHVIVGALSCYVIFRSAVYYYRYLQYLPAHVYDLSFSLLIILGLLLSPLAWVYYYLFLVVPVATLLKINCEYRLSIYFYGAFAAAMLMPILSWLTPSNTILLIVRQFSAFADLFVWIICLHLAAIEVKDKNKKILFAPAVSMAILTASGLLTVMLLLGNYGFPHYFSIDKSAYEKENPPGMWMSQ